MPSSPPPMPEDTARFAAVDAPPRVRRLLGALLALSRQSLTAPLTLTVVELERELLREAERARNSQVQADLFAQARQIHPFAEGFSQRFLEQLAQALAALFAPPGEAPAAVEPQRPSMSALTLVNDTDIDRDIVLNEIMRREMLRSANALQLLGQRLAVLAAAPALDAEHVPFGPTLLCGIVRRIGDEAGLELEAQLALYRSFERQVLERLGELLERTNVLLGHEGVLPGLVYTPYLARSAATRRIVTQPGRSQAGGARAHTTPVTSWNGASSNAASSGSAMMQAELGGHPAPAGANPPPLPTGTQDQLATAVPVVDLAAPAMSALHELLAGARHAMAAGAAPTPGLEAPLPGAAAADERVVPGAAPDANAVPSAMVDA
ncbi:MAG: DUF1631 family protein, partial [Stenotrophomonas chelatiphaga]